MIRHHPESDLILGYAAGTLPEAVSLAVATHLALCALCRDETKICDSVGGGLLGQIEPVSLADGALDRVLDRIAKEPSSSGLGVNGGQTRAQIQTDVVVPGPLRRYLNRDLETLPWRRLTGAIRAAGIGPDNFQSRARLLRVKAGHAVPAHTHLGNEFTLVLAGQYRDGAESFARGDFQTTGPDLSHQPTAADAADCVCLVVLDAPLRFTTGLARLLNPLLRY